MDVWKIVFFLMVGPLVAVGSVMAVLGLYTPSTAIEQINQSENLKDYKVLLESALYTLGVIGLILLSVGALGFIGVIWNFLICKSLFYFFVVIIIVLMLFSASLATAAVQKMLSEYKLSLKPKMEMINSDPDDNPEVQPEVHALQISTPCCGLAGETIYVREKKPFSCCVHDPDIIIDGRIDQDKYAQAQQEGKACSDAKVQELQREGCDAANELIKLGQIVAYYSFAAAGYLIAIVVVGCCLVKPPTQRKQPEGS